MILRTSIPYENIPLIFLFFSLTACSGQTSSKVIDLTYPFGDQTIYWPNAKPFQWKKSSWGTNASGQWYAAGAFSASEHGGTHGVRIDTASIDPGRSKDFPVHRILEANLYGLENVAALDQLPPRGALVTALPLKIRGGSGGTVRIMATIL